MTAAAVSPPLATSVEEVPAPARPVAVCHVTMTLETGGAERLLVETAKHLDPARLDFRFVPLGNVAGPGEELRAMGRPVQSMEFPGAVGKLGLVRKLRRHFLDSKPDVVHAHNTYAQFYASIAAKLAGVPVVVVTQHGRGCGPNKTAVRQFRIANRWTDAVVGVSEDAVALCRGQDPKSSAKMRCLWNGVDLNRFAYRDPADAPSGPAVTAIAVARLSPEKDPMNLLEAVAFVRDRQPQLRVKVVGDGVEMPRLEAFVAEHGLKDCVELLGERSDVQDLLASADFFVSSSRTEGISLTFLEAMGVGLPVLATRVGGNPEIVVEGETGLLVPAQDPAALADGLDAICRRRSDWTDMGRAGRARVEEHFSLGAMIDGYASLYHELLNAKGFVSP